jgi:hypothetical protein
MAITDKQIDAAVKIMQIIFEASGKKPNVKRLTEQINYVASAMFLPLSCNDDNVRALINAVIDKIVTIKVEAN